MNTTVLNAISAMCDGVTLPAVGLGWGEEITEVGAGGMGQAKKNGVLTEGSPLGSLATGVEK